MGKLINKLKKYHMGQEIILLGFIVVLIIIISLVSGKAYSFESFLDTLKSSSPYMIWAVGVLLVMLSGGIDISFSSIAAVTAYLTLFYQNNTGRGNLFLSILIAGLMGLCLGLFNATLISIFDLPAMIVTLATS
ncbi:MAG: ABC transporter permease, partial [Candidatus Cloacimonetes bacterium]|nr:ABC transporter permease [Candidatus Cloacimonadota bacterium]